MKNYKISFFFFSLISINFYLLLHTENVGNSFSASSLMASVIPITMYFFTLLYYRQSITKNDIDSVYYFGFLVTIITLGISASSFTSDGSSIDKITKQFSIGLIATGLALIYRILLMNFKEEESEDLIKLMKETNEQLDTFRQRSSSMFYELEIASKKLSELSNQSIIDVSMTHEKAQAQLESIQQKSLSIMTETLNKSLSTVLVNLKEASHDASLTVANFSTNIQALSVESSLKELPSSLSGLNRSISGFKLKVDESLSTVEGSSKVLNNHLDILSTTLINSKDLTNNLELNSKIAKDSLHNLDNGIKITTSNISNLSDELIKLDEKLNSLTQQPIASENPDKDVAERLKIMNEYLERSKKML